MTETVACGDTKTPSPRHGRNNEPWTQVGGGGTGALYTFTPTVTETVRWSTCASRNTDNAHGSMSGSTEITVDGGITVIDNDVCNHRNEDHTFAVTTNTPVTLGARWTYTGEAGTPISVTLFCPSTGKFGSLSMSFAVQCPPSPHTHKHQPQPLAITHRYAVDPGVSALAALAEPQAEILAG